MGRASYGVSGIKLNKGDKVVSLEVLPQKDKREHSILTITKNGYGKRSEIDSYRLTGRGGKGVINMKVTDKNGKIITSESITDKDNVIAMTEKGIVIRMPVKNIRVMGRATQGVRVIKLKDDDKLSDFIRIPSDEVVEYADRHSGTMGMQPGAINPYKLGLELFRHIEDRWNKGRFGNEWNDCDDLAMRRTWDLKLGKGREKIFEVRRTHNDITFIDEFLTFDFVRDQKLFAFAYNTHHRGQKQTNIGFPA